MKARQSGADHSRRQSGLGGLRWAPGGGRLAGCSATRTRWMYSRRQPPRRQLDGPRAHAGRGWKWLPKTALVLQISQGYIVYLNTDVKGESKPTSFPLHVMAGIRGLITAKLAVNLAPATRTVSTTYQPDRPGALGFQGKFSAWPTSDYHPTILTSIGLGYRRDFQNAILGDFYYVDSVYSEYRAGDRRASRYWVFRSATRAARSRTSACRLPTARSPAGTITTVQVGANLDYHIRDWTYAGVAYTLLANSSPYEPMAPRIRPGELRQAARLCAAWRHVLVCDSMWLAALGLRERGSELAAWG